jgi:ATP/maltotriose-dependent transcriptional regulator MalT/two-component SAPR family response regulator
MTSKQDIILQTKLQCPERKGRILERPRLMTILRQNLDKKLIIVSADAGYGKTTLLSQLCSEIGKGFVFYSLDPRDSDLTVFFTYLCHGVKKQVADFDGGLTHVLGKTRDIPIIVGTFINDLFNKVKADFYIVIDDFHHTQHNRILNEAVEYLMRHAPANLHLIIASRAVPSFDFNSYQAKQELLFVGKDELRFDEAETKLLLKDVYGMAIIDQEIERITKHTEGWITAIQLILQKICDSGADTTKQILNGYLVSGEDIFNYFAREVYESQPSVIKEFLVRTSILDTLTPEACDHLLNSKRSKHILEHLDSSHLFLSRVGTELRYHPIFQEFLARKLRGMYPGQKVKRLYSQVAEFFARRKDRASAVNYYLHAEDYERAARILEQDLLVQENSASQAGYITLIDRFPETVVNGFPWLVLQKVRYLLDRGRIEHAARALRGTIRFIKKSRNRRHLAEAYFLLIRIHNERIEPLQALRYARLAYGLSRKFLPEFKRRALIQFGHIYRVLGNYKKAESSLQEALKLARKANDTQAENNAMRFMAYFYWAKFNYQKAEDIFAEFLEKNTEPDYDHGSICVGAAMVAIYNRHFQRASDYLRKAEHVAAKYNDLKAIKGRLFAQGDLHYQMGEYRKALDLYQEAYDMRSQFEDRFYDINILISMAMTYLKLDNIAAAERTLKETESILPPMINPTIMIEYTTVKGEIERMRGRYQQCMKYFGRALKDAVKFAQPYQEMIVNYKLAELHNQRNEHARTSGSLKKAFAIAEKNGYDAYLITEGLHDLSMIKAAAANGPGSGYLKTLLRRIDTDDARNLLLNMNLDDGNYNLECTFLGGMSLHDRSGKVLALNWRTKKCKSILAFLLINLDRGCSKEELIDTYWQDRTIMAAAHSLQVEVSALRKELGGIVDSSEPILFKNQRYRINPLIMIKTDIREFDTLAKKARAERDTSSRSKILQKALELYRGDFCPDIMENWAEDKRLYYKDAAIRMIKELAGIFYDAKDYRKALDNYQHALRLDGFDETTHAGVFRCFAAMGNQQAVIRQYQLLKRNLKSIGISQPSSETTRIYEQCLE